MDMIYNNDPSSTLCDKLTSCSQLVGILEEERAAEEAARLEAEQQAEARRRAAEEARREAEFLAAKQAEAGKAHIAQKQDVGHQTSVLLNKVPLQSQSLPSSFCQTEPGKLTSFSRLVCANGSITDRAFLRFLSCRGCGRRLMTSAGHGSTTCFLLVRMMFCG